MGEVMSGYQSKKKAAQAKLTTEEEQMKIVEIKDYAYPCMMAEKAVKNVYELMLKNDSGKAIEQCNIAMQEIINIINAIKK
jgi:hypothetical protein